MGELLPALIAERLMGYRREAGVAGLWARVALTTRGKADWLVVHPNHLSQARPPRWAEKEDGQSEALTLGSGLWGTASVDKSLPAMGRIVFHRQGVVETPREVEALEHWASQIGSAVREFRRQEGARRLLEVPTAPATVKAAHDALEVWARALQALLGADGVKVTLARRSPGGPITDQVVNTRYGVEVPKKVAYSTEFGLGDWVLRRREWLLAAEMRDAEEVALAGSVFRGFRRKCLTSSGSWEVVTSRPEKMVNEAGLDDESSMLFFPLTTDDSVTGVVAAWRLLGIGPGEDPEPIDADIDIQVFSQFAPHGATACQRLVQLEKLKDQLGENRKLASQLAKAENLAVGFEALASGAGRLADAPAAIVCRIDREGSGVALYEVARWRDPSLDPAPEGTIPVHLKVEGEAGKWSDQVKAALDPGAGLEFRRLLLPPTSNANENRELPRLAVALLDRQPLPNGPSFFSDELLIQFATNFVQTAEALLESQGRTLGSRLVDQLVGPQAGHSPREATAEGVMAEATERVVELLGADAGLLYLGPSSDMRIAQSWPPREALLGQPVAPNSRTEACIKEKRAEVIVDALRDPQDLNQVSLAQIRDGFGWRAVRSWLCCPLLYQGRVIGLWKFLTRGSGRFLGPDHLEVVEKVAPHAAWEAQRAARSTMLSASLELATALTGHHGQKLEALLAEKLGQWVDRVLKRDNARIAVIARLEEGRAFLRAASAGIAAPHLEDLDRFSLQVHGKAFGGSLGRPLPEPLAALGPFVIAEPIAVPGGGERLAGQVFFIDDTSFGIEDRDALQEVTRTLAVVLNAERERNELKEAMGRYRHAVLGPIQGAISNALELVEQTTEGVAPELLALTKAKVLEEGQILRLWRENQRFYQTERVELKLQRVSSDLLRTLIERAFQRYQDIAEARNIRLLPDRSSNSDRPFRLPLDEYAMDLVVSNLVDNAVKYAFYNTTIKAGVARKGNRAELWVEDIGHGIEKKIIDEIFDPGRRAVDFDPFRWITGSGLGLTLSRRIVEAHHGEISARSRELGPGYRAETTPYLVRFTVFLPLAH